MVDSDWAGSADRKSTDCICAKLLGANTHVSVKTQGNLSTSSGQAELGGIQRGAMFGVYLQNVWHASYGELLHIVVHADSAAGKVMGTRRGCGKVRHLEIRELYIQQLTNSGRVRIEKVAGQLNEADIGTKVLDQKSLEELMEMHKVANPVLPTFGKKTRGGGITEATATKALAALTLFQSLMPARTTSDYYYEDAPTQTEQIPIYSWRPDGSTFAMFMMLLLWLGAYFILKTGEPVHREATASSPPDTP